ncbi:MAG: bacillithiol system redox-active protein YtxJ [Calditrichaeota bacterium]|nr:bacillithiol system redox-active protein YtxJ [Calditrichota bacterium]
MRNLICEKQRLTTEKPVNALKSEADYQQMLQKSHQTPTFLFKHSTRCGISAGAFQDFAGFLRAHPEVSSYQLLVIEDRPVSNFVAQVTGIPHKSPQVFLFWQGQPVWHTSHWAIREKSLSAALAALPTPG